MSAPSKKPNIAIQAFKTASPTDRDMAARSWEKLEKAIMVIFHENIGTSDIKKLDFKFEELYRTGYNMVLHKHGEYLYQQLDMTFRRLTNELFERDVRNIAEDHDVPLAGLTKLWEDHKKRLKMVRDILMYMDRTFVKLQNRRPVYDMGVMIFVECYVRSPRIRDRVRDVLLGLIDMERRGETIDRDLLKGMTHMLYEIGKDIYVEDFEKPLIEASRRFYQTESETYLTANSCPDYLRKIEALLNEENDRVSTWLPSAYGGGENSIKQVMEHELIGRHMEVLIDKEESGLARLLEDDKVDDLGRMLDMFSRVKGGSELIVNRVAVHFAFQNGQEIVQVPDNQQDHLLFIKKLLDHQLMKAAFHNDKNKNFVSVVDKCIAHFLNVNQQSPEYISLTMDRYLRGAKTGKSESAASGAVDSTEEQVEQQLEKCVQLFRCLQEKDVFEKYYQQHLARRLLYDRSQSEELERKVIQMLKIEGGYQFTAKLEGMFKDLNTSKDLQERFSQHRIASAEAGGGTAVELQVKILTTGCWPTLAVAQCRLPAELENICTAFKRYYLAQHNARQLTWQLNMGSADVKARYDRVYQINMPTYHMVVLLLFADAGAESLTFEEIEAATNIPAADLKRTLHSLALTHLKLLTKEPNGKEVEAKDKFSYNAGFSHKMIKFKLSVASAAKETNEEAQASRAKINEDRNPQIDAAIVRVMKARQSLEHNLLIAEVTKQLLHSLDGCHPAIDLDKNSNRCIPLRQQRFEPNPVLIKKRIEGLIDREFLQRSKSDNKVYEV